MKKSDDITKRFNKGIQSYLDGTMKGKERNSFERMLEQDPFLREALEGYSVLDKGDIARDLRLLDKRLMGRLRKRTPFFFRIAAALVVLLVISSVLLIRELNRPAMMVSENIQPEPAGDIEGLSGIVVDSIGEETDRSAAAVQQQDVNQAKEVKTEGDIAGDELLFEDIEAVQLEEEIAFAETKEAVATTEQAAAVKAEDFSVSYPTATRSRKAAKSESIALEVPVSRSLEYEAELPGREDAHELADLPPDREASPLGGMKEYRRYLADEQIFPLDWTESDREIVKVRFIIDSLGIPSDIEIIRSPGDKFSEEAFRLVREGPPWIPAARGGKNVEGEAEIKIVFRRNP